MGTHVAAPDASLTSQVRSIFVGAAPPQTIALATIVMVGAALRLWVALLPLPTLIAHVTPDDAFYYFQIGRNVSRGYGVSFDGGASTNGFHPLWMAAVVASYCLPISDEVALRVALCFSAVVAALGCIPLASLGAGLTKRASFGVLVAGAYAVSPAAVLFSVNGLETGLLLTTFIFCCERFYRFSEGADRSRALSFGIAGGLLVLARTDYAVVFAAMLVVGFASGQRHRAMQAAVVGALVTLPWFLWELVFTGTLLQSSARAVPLAAHGNGPSGSSAILHGLDLWREAWVTRIPDDYFFHGLPAALQLVGISAMGCLLLFVLLRSRGDAPARSLWYALCGGLVLLTFTHAAVRWYYREWYAPTVIPSALLLVAAALSAIISPAVRRLVTGAAIAGTLTVFAVDARQQYVRPRYAIQSDMLNAGRWLDENAATGDVVAALNAGIVGYVGDRKTIDLDGVVDESALEAVKDHRLLSYADSRCVAYLAEFPFYVFWYDRFWGGAVNDRLTPVTSFASARQYQPAEIASDFTIWAFRNEHIACRP